MAGLQVQIINSEMIAFLRSRFLLLEDPARTIRSTDNVASPPTDAELDAAFDVPANLPENSFYVVDDAGTGTTMWLCLSDKANGAWWYVQLTKAV